MAKKTRVTVGSIKGKLFINVYLNGKRFRYWNGSSIGVAVSANDEPELLKSAFQLKLRDGWLPENKKPKKTVPKATQPFLECLRVKLESTLQGNYSYHQKRDCKWVFNLWAQYSSIAKLDKATPSKIDNKAIKEFILQSKWSSRTQKNVLRTLIFLTKDIDEIDRSILSVRITRSKSTLHKPIKDVPELLNEIEAFNDALYICSLLTYACLLRPHQEIRLLKWSDIDFDRDIISLSGSRNKSGRNRIVPMPKYVKRELLKRYTSQEQYVLRNSNKPYSRDYLKVLWRRFKIQAKSLDNGITLYSLRHTGALKVFEKTGSLRTLQEVMGHSDMKVSLTYLRGLEVQQLDVNDLPDL